MSKNIPEMRFEGFIDDWEQRKWSDVVDISTEMVDPRTREYDDLPHVAPGNIESFTGQLFDNIKLVKEENLVSGKFHFYDGDIIYGKINPQLGKYVFARFEGLTSADAYVLNAKNGIDQKYLFAVLQTKDFYDYSVSVSKRSGMPKINRNELNAYSFLAPFIDEQSKIGQLLLEIDHLITLHQRKYDKLVATKKSMLDKMFPKKGCNVPEIRFKRFSESWEEKELGEIFKEYSEKNHEELPALMIIQGGGTIKREESERNLSYDRDNLANYKMVNEGDFIVHLRSFEGGLEIATNTGLISPAYHTLHGENTDSRFYYSYFRSRKFIDIDLKPHVYGIRDGRSIDIAGMKTIKIPYTNYDEQKAIGDYIESLDILIALHKQELKKLENIKKSLLDKMFV